jgi:hypothetical protein
MFYQDKSGNPDNEAGFTIEKKMCRIGSSARLVAATTTTTSATTSVTRDDVSNVTSAHGSNGLIKEITSKFLSSSVASTNIMDTSEMPMPMVNHETTARCRFYETPFRPKSFWGKFTYILK